MFKHRLAPSQPAQEITDAFWPVRYAILGLTFSALAASVFVSGLPSYFSYRGPGSRESDPFDGLNDN